MTDEKWSRKLSSEVINLKLIWFKQSWDDENRVMFHHLSRSDEGAYVLVMKVMECVWIQK